MVKFRKTSRAFFATAAILLSSIAGTSQVTTFTYNYTGAVQSFTVPSCVSTVSVDARGAAGGNGYTFISSGGLGGRVTAVISVTPGQVLQIFVGGAGGNAGIGTGGTAGYNGGGAGKAWGSSGGGGGGGGASDIRISPYALADRIIVAGGGGGAAYNYSSTNFDRGGPGGGTTGGTGFGGNSQTGSGVGTGGSQSAGGTGGTYPSYCTANSGSLGLGAAGGGTCSNTGGGGGGGYYGGGGGVWAGGGGGSSYAISTSSSVVHTQGSQSGNGQVFLSYAPGLVTTIVSTAGSSTICAGSTVDLSLTSTLSLTGYTWSTGSNSSSISVTPSVGTVYTVAATNGSCVATAAMTIATVPGVPSLTVVNSASGTSNGVCPTKTATLTASGAFTYTWTGLNNVTNGASFTPTVASDYTVVGQNACGTSSAVTSISIHPVPVVGITAQTGSICSGNTTTLVVTGNSISHTITTAISAPQVTNNVGFQPAVTNTYIVTGANNVGCTVTANASVQVVQTPTLAPTSTTLLLCIGKSATLTATGATGGYTWTSGTSTLATTPTLAITPNTTTTYSVTKNSATCFDTKPITIQVNNLTPVFAAANQTLVCASKPTTLSAFGGVAYTWFSSAAPTVSFSASSNPVVSPSVNTTYTVAASDGTCINTAVVSVSTNPNPTINVVTSGTTVCIGSVVTLTAFGGINYTWTSVPATPTVTGTDNIAPSFTAPGAYAFNVTGDNSFNCTSGNVAVIIVNSPPTLSASATKSVICSGNSTTLSITGANSVQWDANANSATTVSTVVNPTSTTVYNVSGTLTATGCSSSTNVVVHIYTPTISILSPTSTCLGSAVTLTGQVNNPSSGAVNSYTWSGPGVPPNSLGQSVVVTPTALTVYTLSAKSTTLGNLVCTEQKTTSLGIYYNPTITVAPSRTFVCRNEPVDLVAFGGQSYTWNNNSFAGTTITVSHNNVGTVAYTVVGTDANGCKNDTIYYLKINGCQGIEEMNANSLNLLVYPNPNSGAFTLVGEQAMSLLLINELGQVVKQLELNAFNEHHVEVADLAKGIYFITSSNGAAVTRQKIIVK